MRKISLGLLLAAGLLCGCPQDTGKGGTTNPSTDTTPHVGGDKPAGDKPAGDKPAGDKPAAAKDDSGDLNFWKGMGEGSSLEYSMETHMEKPMASDTKMTSKQTLVKKTDKDYSVKTEMSMNGTAMPAGEPTVTPWATATAADPAAPKPTDLGNEKITTPAGDFDCKKYKSETKTGEMTTTSTSWMSKGVPIKTESKTEGPSMSSSTVMTLIKMDKK